MVKPLGLSLISGHLFVCGWISFFSVPESRSEEYVFNLPLTRSVTQIEKGEATRSSSRPGDKGGDLFATGRRVFKQGNRYFHENTYEDKQVIKQEISLIGDTPEQVWFYWLGGIAPRLIVFSKLSKTVVVLDVASFTKEHGDKATKDPFTEVVLEYGNYTFRK